MSLWTDYDGIILEEMGFNFFGQSSAAPVNGIHVNGIAAPTNERILTLIPFSVVQGHIWARMADSRPFLANAVWPSTCVSGAGAHFSSARPQSGNSGGEVAFAEGGVRSIKCDHFNQCQACCGLLEVIFEGEQQLQRQLEEYREKIVELEIHNEHLTKALQAACGTTSAKKTLGRTTTLSNAASDQEEQMSVKQLEAKFKAAKLAVLSTKAVSNMQASGQRDSERMEEIARRCEAAELAAATAEARAERLQHEMLAIRVTSALQNGACKDPSVLRKDKHPPTNPAKPAMGSETWIQAQIDRFTNKPLGCNQEARCLQVAVVPVWWRLVHHAAEPCGSYFERAQPRELDVIRRHCDKCT